MLAAAATEDGAAPHAAPAALTTTLADGTLRLDAGADRDEAQEALLALPGRDPHTAVAVRARALGDPDAAPPGEDVPDAWRP